MGCLENTTLVKHKNFELNFFSHSRSIGMRGYKFLLLFMKKNYSCTKRAGEIIP